MPRRKLLTIKNFGVALMLLGLFVILSALPLIPASIVQVGPIVTEVSPINATRIAVGSVIFVLGLITYFGKEALRILK